MFSKKCTLISDNNYGKDYTCYAAKDFQASYTHDRGDNKDEEIFIFRRVNGFFDTYHSNADLNTENSGQHRL